MGKLPTYRPLPKYHGEERVLHHCIPVEAMKWEAVAFAQKSGNTQDQALASQKRLRRFLALGSLKSLIDSYSQCIFILLP